MSTTILVFSKDRPFQLKEYLRSFQLFAGGEYKIIVLWSSNDYQREYKDLASNNIVNITFVEQGTSFIKNLSHILDTIDTPYVMFGVDDLIWYNKFNLAVAERCLEEDQYVFGFSFRLHQNIRYCHPAKLYNRIPPLTKITDDCYTYDCHNGSVDFSYPFELCASLYRTQSIRYLLQGTLQGYGAGCVRNPNDFEAKCCETALRHNLSKNACINRPCCSVITVNRVQVEYQNPVYDGLPLEELNKCYWSGDEIDLEWYQKREFDRIHIKELVFNYNKNYE